MATNKPSVTGNILRYQEQGHEQVVSVGTPAWYAWLQSARAFTFRTSSCQFTARKEQAGNRRGDWYWKAYYRRSRKLCSAYLGKSEHLSLFFQFAGARLAQFTRQASARGNAALSCFCDSARRWRPPGMPSNAEEHV